MNKIISIEESLLLILSFLKKKDNNVINSVTCIPEIAIK